MGRNATTPERFWARVNEVDGCWEWTGRIDPHTGYGVVPYSNRPCGAHRLACHFAHGPIPAGLSVLHACDNRRCGNPGHLFLGTQGDKVRDMMRKRRHRTPRGAARANATFTAEHVRVYRARHHAGESGYRLWKEHGGDQSGFSKMLRGETYRDAASPTRPAPR